MGVDRELRSRKRQTTGLTSFDGPPVNSLPPDQMPSIKRQVHLECDKLGRSNCRTAASYSNTDNKKERKNFAREKCDEVSKRPFIRKKYCRIKGNPVNQTNGKLDSLNITPFKKELGIENEYNSADLFPETNGKFVDTMHTFKWMNSSVSEPRLSPALKAQKIDKLISSLEDDSESLVHHLDSGRPNENSAKIGNKDDTELEQKLNKLRNYAAERGRTIGPGWKVQVTGNRVKNYFYISPNNIKFNSMKKVGKYLKHMEIWKEEEPDRAEPSGGVSSVSVCMNTNHHEVEAVTGNLDVDQVPHKRDMEAKNSSEVTTSVVAEHGTNKGCKLIQESYEIQAEPLHNTFHLGIEDGKTGSLQSFNEMQVELLSESSNLGTQERHIGPLQSSNKAQMETCSGLSDLGIKDGNTEVKHVTNSLVPTKDLENSKHAQSSNETQMEMCSGLSDLGIKDGNTEDRNINSLTVLNVKDIENSKHTHWTEVLEEILSSSCMTAGGIRSSISKALASGPPECAKLFQQTISKDASHSSGTIPMKEAVSSVLAWYRGEKLGNMHAEREKLPEKTRIVQKVTDIEKDTFINDSGRRMLAHNVVSSSDMVTKRCCDVFFKIISSEKFVALCNLVRGSFAESKMQDVFDFRHIDSKMNAGTYGKSPELFALDMQQLWKNVHKIGREMVLLADALSQLSQNFYEKEVAAMLKSGAAQSYKLDAMDRTTIDGILLDQGEQSEETFDQRKDKFRHIHKVENIKNDSATAFKNLRVVKESGRVTGDGHVADLNGIRKNVSLSTNQKAQISLTDVDNANSQCQLCEQCDLPSSGTESINLCKVCGIEISTNSMLICDACEAAYHMYCLSPPMEEIPSGSWYCPSCYASGRGSPEVDSFHDRQDIMLIEGGRDTIVYHCVVCERLSKMQNVEPNRQAESQSGRGGDGANIQREEEVELSAQQLNLHTNKSDMAANGSGQEQELHNEEQENEKVCKVCSVGEKDGRCLIECSNTSCVSRFYHISCLTPKLDTIPSPGWYCASCLCRVCFIDENDEFIILCDDCDEGYHIYCLDPPLDEIPEGKWYCPSCLRKQKRKRRKKDLENAANKSTEKVHPEKKSEMVNQILSGKVEVLNYPSGGNVGSPLSQKPASRVRSKKMNSEVTPDMPTVFSNCSLPSLTTKPAKVVKSKASRKRKRIC